jgi:hypothetical protein
VQTVTGIAARLDWAVVGPMIVVSALLFLVAWAFSHHGAKRFDHVARHDLSRWRFVQYGPRNSRATLTPALTVFFLSLLLQVLIVPRFFPSIRILISR